MPGYPIHDVMFQDSDALNRFLCPKCNLLLKDPVQPSCGHRLCKSCAEEIVQNEHATPRCPDCEEAFDDGDGIYVSNSRAIKFAAAEQHSLDLCVHSYCKDLGTRLRDTYAFAPGARSHGAA